MRLQGRVAIVTGSAQGLGKVFAMRLAKEGARIVSSDINGQGAEATSRDLGSNGLESISMRVDVSNEADTLEMARRTVETYGRIDVLVNNAAVYYGMSRKPLDDITVDEWDRMMAVNVKGCWLTAKAVASQMKRQGKGKIINISSSSIFGAPLNMCHYITSKAAVIGLTRALARELGRYGINVNAVTPGFTLTDASLLLGEDFRRSKPPVRCLGRDEYPEDVAGTVVFLASDDSDFWAGQTLVVDGGEYLR